MVPQVAAEEGEVRLYKARPADFPEGWRFHRVGAAALLVLCSVPCSVLCCAVQWHPLLGQTLPGRQLRRRHRAVGWPCGPKLPAACSRAPSRCTLLTCLALCAAGAAEGGAAGREHCAPQPQVVAGGQRRHRRRPRCVRPWRRPCCCSLVHWCSSACRPAAGETPWRVPAPCTTHATVPTARPAAAPPAGGQDHVLRLLRSKSPLGPWEPHLGGRLAAENALTMGPLFKWKNSLHRLGRACRGGECGPVEVNQVGALVVMAELLLVLRGALGGLSLRRGAPACRRWPGAHHLSRPTSAAAAAALPLPTHRCARCCSPPAQVPPLACHALSGTPADVHFRGGL